MTKPIPQTTIKYECGAYQSNATIPLKQQSIIVAANDWFDISDPFVTSRGAWQAKFSQPFRMAAIETEHIIQS